MSEVYVEAFETVYQDNYENGEVDGTLQVNECFKKHFVSKENEYPHMLIARAISEVIKFFNPTDYYSEDGKVYLTFPMQSLSEEGFLFTADNKEIEDWKDGKIDLYNKDITVNIKIMNDVDEKLLKEAIGK